MSRYKVPTEAQQKILDEFGIYHWETVQEVFGQCTTFCEIKQAITIVCNHQFTIEETERLAIAIFNELVNFNESRGKKK